MYYIYKNGKHSPISEEDKNWVQNRYNYKYGVTHCYGHPEGNYIEISQSEAVGIKTRFLVDICFINSAYELNDTYMISTLSDLNMWLTEHALIIKLVEDIDIADRKAAEEDEGKELSPFEQQIISAIENGFNTISDKISADLEAGFVHIGEEIESINLG